MMLSTQPLVVRALTIPAGVVDLFSSIFSAEDTANKSSGALCRGLRFWRGYE